MRDHPVAGPAACRNEVAGPTDADGARTPFRPGDVALVRAAVAPISRADEARLDVGTGEPDELPRLVAYVTRLTDDVGFREALILSSPSLGRLVTTLRAGTEPPVADLRRAALALTRYWLRFCGRATPFGLMAGVALASFGDPHTAAVRLGENHRRSVRVDQGWLAALTRRLERDPGVVRQLPVVANDLCFVRAGRLVVPRVPEPDPGRDGRGGPADPVELTIRNTGPVAVVRQLADRPVDAAVLATRLTERFPSLGDDAAMHLIAQLVEHGALVTDLTPPVESDDPLGHVIDRIEPADPALRNGLAEVRECLTACAAAGTSEALDHVQQLMRAVEPSDRLIHLDTALDADVTLPVCVAQEAARVAGVLWRLSPPETDPDHLRRYRADFLERYGVGRLVPLKALLDPDAELGPPAGYRVPAGTRLPTAEPPTTTDDGQRVLAELVQEVMLSGADELVLDDALVDVVGTADGVAPRSMDLTVQILADSVDAVRSGDFELALPPRFGLRSAGATFGRFAHLLGDADPAGRLADVVRHAPDDDGFPAQLVYRPSLARFANLTQVPRWLGHRIPVAVFDDRAEGSLGLDDLAVGAEHDRLYLYAPSLRRRITPVKLHAVDTSWAAPNVVRFLDEIAWSGIRRVSGWQWGILDDLPYLPRVRYGRTILSPARWRPAPALCDSTSTTAEWERALAAWRSRLRVPDRVHMTQADRSIPLDLTDPLHRRLLRHDLQRSTTVLVHEQCSASRHGWLAGHVSEVVIPLVRGGDRPGAVDDRRVHPAPPPRGEPMEHRPGGEWLYVKLYATPARQAEILGTALHGLVTDSPGIDRWFFVRYRDRDPHLRLRFHGSPACVAALTPRVHDWTNELRSDRLVSNVVLDTYDPELERYGGPEAIATAERVFHADSALALGLLRAQRDGTLDVDPVLLAAASTAAMARAFLGDADTARRWLTHTLPAEDGHDRAFARHRARVLDVVDPYRDPSVAGPLLDDANGHDVIGPAWRRRAQAVADYATLLRRLGDRSWSACDAVLTSLVHMQFNRLCGIDPHEERRARATARRAAAAHHGRRIRRS